LNGSAKILTGAFWFLIANQLILGASFVQIPVGATDLAYSEKTGLIYVPVNIQTFGSSIPNNQIVAFDPQTGTIVQTITDLRNVTRAAVSSDANKLYAVYGGGTTVQAYEIPSASKAEFINVFKLPFVIGNISEIDAIPGRPNAMLVHEADSSAREIGAGIVLENGTALPRVTIRALPAGGPTLVSVDPTDGTRALGFFPGFYDPHFPGAFDVDKAQLLTVDDSGIHASAVDPFLTPVQPSRLALVGDKYFLGGGANDTNPGEVIVMPAVPGASQLSSLIGATFVVDPELNRVFTVGSDGSTGQILRAYSLDTLTLIGSDTLPGVSGTPLDLVRFGSDGLAFRVGFFTKVVFAHSAIVPEPSSIVLAIVTTTAVSAFFARIPSSRSRNKRRTGVDP